jgi:hypothetical protein
MANLGISDGFAPAFVDLVDELGREGSADSFQAWKRAIRLGDGDTNWCQAHVRFTPESSR